MQIEEFVRTYQAKSDEELIRLAVDSEQLTSEARLALQGELSRRSISTADNSKVSQHNGDGHDVRRPTLSERQQTGDVQAKAAISFLAEVVQTYQNHFWLFFRITAPAVIISMVAVISAHNEMREISRHLLRDLDLAAHRTEILEMQLLEYSAWFLSWMAFFFVYGAICIAVEESAAGFTASAWRSFLNIRERLSPFLLLSVLLWVLAAVTEGASALLATGVFWVLHRWGVHPTSLLIRVVSFGLAGLALLVVSRFLLAVPAVIIDDCGVGPAMFRSDKLTQGKWLTLAALLAKSIIGGYIAAMCPFWLASIIHFSVPPNSLLRWILTIASIIAVTVVEPTMFVGFALLYLKMTALDSAPDKVLTRN